jgi:DNA ligase (NAD+)
VQLESSDMPKEILSEKLIGKTFLISGTFNGFGREELKEIIEQHGGKVLSGVSSKLNFLVAGKEAGASKLDKAAKLNVAVIGESDFVKMIS